ncbi:hypothetical protein STEG23_013658, partial [Scotinomys teguina]
MQRKPEHTAFCGIQETLNMHLVSLKCEKDRYFKIPTVGSKWLWTRPDTGKLP